MKDMNYLKSAHLVSGECKTAINKTGDFVNVVETLEGQRSFLLSSVVINFRIMSLHLRSKYSVATVTVSSGSGSGSAQTFALCCICNNDP